MFLSILGVIILIVGFILSTPNHPASRYGNLIKIVGIVIMLIGLSLSMFKVIDAGEVGVKTVFGRVDN